MAQWHLDDLRNALDHLGWRFEAEHPGDDYRISATWEFSRSSPPTRLLIDFDGLDDMKTLPLLESYGCRVRDTTFSLYFGKRGEPESRARKRWAEQLATFAAALSQGQAGADLPHRSPSSDGQPRYS
jgi:hypothetical protein